MPRMKEIELPAGYRREELESGVELIALPEAWDGVRQALETSGTLFDYAASRPGAVELAGRGVAYHIAAPGAYTDERWVVRHYRRGGFIARLLHDRYVDTTPRRPLRELAASAKARERGVSTPEVVAAVAYPVGGWYRADIATRYLPDSRDLASRLFDEQNAELRRQAMHHAGALMRSAHEAGVVHNDLNLKNVLISGSGDDARAWLLDLDRAVVMRDAAAKFERNLMLRRFGRSLRKFEKLKRRKLKDGEREAFAHAYATTQPNRAPTTP